MRDEKKSIIALISFFSLLLCGIIEKFIYSNEYFNINRVLVCFFCFFFFLCVVYFLVSKKYRYLFLKKYLSFLKWSFSTLSIFNRFNFLKIGFSLIITFYAGCFLKNIYYILFGICEIFLIVLISNFIINKFRIFGKIINDILFLLYNINYVVLIFGGSFVTFIMINNLSSLEDLKGKMVIYIFGIVLVLLFSFLPFYKIKINTKKNILVCVEILLLEIILTLLYSNSYSSFCNYILLIQQEIRYINLQNYIKNSNHDKNIFLKQGVDDYINYNNNFAKNPNVIVIFTEGLSKNIINDERDIMPNVRKYMNKSISFSNYYNHTAATYRGLIGQLYSGYQLENLDTNNLISIQSILSSNGYNTEFINTEPNNLDFSKYLDSFGFDSVTNSSVFDGYVDSVSDKSAYNFLYERAIKLNNSNKPFFLGIYTFGTHVSFNSTDKIFSDGSDNILNRFYNVDYQFGVFMDKFINSDLYNNTIVIFTTDHASFVDYDYLRTFKDTYSRQYGFVDEIPLFIYHNGVNIKEIDVSGRNSLDFAPTVLDYLDISGPNYFLGESLFSPYDKKTNYDTVYSENSMFISTDLGELKNLDEYDKVIVDINNYLAVSSK